MNWYMHVLTEYVTFSGRATRAECWQFVLVHYLVCIGLAVADSILLIDPQIPVEDFGPLGWLFLVDGFGLLGWLYSIPTILLPVDNFGPLGWSYFIATILPFWAVTVRRLHDTGRTGRWLFMGLILPVVGLLVLLVFFVTDSEPNENSFGPNPKSEVA